MNMSASYGIMLATFLNPEMDVNARTESLLHHLRQTGWAYKKAEQEDKIWEQPTVRKAVAILCKRFFITPTPRIEENLKEAVLALSKMRKEEIRREIKGLQDKLEQIMRYEK